MTGQTGYGQFCPVAMAAEIACSRWTILVLRELLAGTTRFNDLRRGVPRMSPTLLSKRLKELEAAGVIATKPTGQPGVVEYCLTPAGKDLRDVIMALGLWGHRWIESKLTLQNLDPSLLMWDMRRRLNPRPLPERRSTIQFQYRDLPANRRNWWLLIEAGQVDLCSVDPGYEVDLHVCCPLRTMTAIWMGLTEIRREIENGHLELIGDKGLSASIQQWLGLSPFALERKRLSA
jgi:DNA-binding HxlR family transcriptional regulator